MTICVSIWSLFNYLADHSGLISNNLFFTHLTYVAGLWLSFSIYALSKFFPIERFTKRISIKYFYLATATGLSIFSFSNYTVRGIEKIKNGVNIDIGQFYAIYVIILLGIFALSIYNFIKSYHQANSFQKNQIKYIIFGFCLSVIAGALLNLILPILLNDWTISKFGPIATLFFIGFSGFAIFKHRLFDIHLVVARSVAYALLLVTLAGVYGLITFGASSYLFRESTVSSGQQTFNIILAIILAFTFQPLKRFFEKITDTIFYRNKYDSQTVLNEVSHILASELILDRILKDTLAKICKDMRVQNGQYYIYDSNKIFKIEHFGPSLNKIITPHELLELKHHMLIADEMEEGPTRRMLVEHDIRISVMLKTKDQFVGYLLLGDKLSGDIYSTQDIALLETLSSELAVGIVNSKAYEKIARFNITLQEKVDEATGNLRIANENLRALDKTKDEFISLASHQLRTPLTTIKGYLSMIQEGDAGKITAQQEEFINYAYLGAERMVRLIADLLNVSRLSSGRFYIENKPLDMAAMVKEEIGQLSQQAEGKNIKLSYQAPKKAIAPILLDDDKIRQVIMNFIDNAVFYTREGSVTVKLEQVGDNIRFTVTDTGIGVPEADKKKLFTKFYRASNAQVLRPDGTGLGIYLAKKVIEEEGGKMIFDSIEGKGSTFGFEIPINLKDREKENQTTSAKTDYKAKETIKV